MDEEARDMIPYFRSLARQPHICPWCNGKARLEPSPKNPNVAVWRCLAPGCSWFQAIEAPRCARMATEKDKADNIICISKWIKGN